jgi:hypothetical protein
LLGLDGEAVEYVVVLVACDLDDLADEDSVGADDIPALLDLQPRDRISHARSSRSKSGNFTGVDSGTSTVVFASAQSAACAPARLPYVILSISALRHGRAIALGSLLLSLLVCSSITAGGTRASASCSRRDQRGHEGAGPGLERLGYAFSKDRVQRGAEQSGACIGVRFPHL